jgi:predicted MFS family arabinose efflux permease
MNPIGIVQISVNQSKICLLPPENLDNRKREVEGFRVKLSNPLVGLAGILVAAMSTELNSTLSAVALPDITAGFGISHDAATWFSSIYATTVVVGMCLAPWFAVTFTLRRVTLFAIALACVTT